MSDIDGCAILVKSRKRNFGDPCVNSPKVQIAGNLGMIMIVLVVELGFELVVELGVFKNIVKLVYQLEVDYDDDEGCKVSSMMMLTNSDVGERERCNLSRYLSTTSRERSHYLPV